MKLFEWLKVQKKLLRFRGPKIYELNPRIDQNLSLAIDEGRIIRIEEYYIYLFANNLIYRVWNQNRWYAWLSNGEVYDLSGNMVDSWRDDKVSARTMSKMWELIKNHPVIYGGVGDNWYTIPNEVLIELGGPGRQERPRSEQRSPQIQERRNKVRVIRIPVQIIEPNIQPETRAMDL